MARKRHTARVAHVTTVHHLRDPRILQKEVGSLRDAGYDVHLVARHTRSETVEGVPVAALRPVQGRYRRLLQLAAAYRAARALQADVYHLHDPELIPVGYALKRSTGAKILYDMHEDYRGHGAVEGRVIRALERWCFTWVDHVVLASDSLLPILEGVRVPHTLVLNFFRPLTEAPPGLKAPPRGTLEVLCAGVQGRARGLEVLLDVAALVHRQNLPVRINLVGVCYRVKDRHWGMQRIANEGLGEIVHLVGWSEYVPWHVMVPYFHAAHVGAALFAPRQEYRATLPTKFYEYLHFGLPILCSDFPRWRAFVAQHGCGAAVCPADPQAVLAQLKRWLQEPAAYARLARAAIEAAPAYRWAVMEARLLALYEQVLAQGPRPPAA